MKTLISLPFRSVGTYWQAIGLAEAFEKITDTFVYSSDNMVSNAGSNNELNIFIEKLKPNLLIIISYSAITRETLQLAKDNGTYVVYWLMDDVRYKNTNQLAPNWDELVDLVDIFFSFQLDPQHQGLNGKVPVYLPLGYNPSLFYPIEKSKKIDIAFCGAPYPNRISVLNEICDERFIITGGHWKKLGISYYVNDTVQNANLTKQIQEKNGMIIPQEENELYNSARICLNIHTTLVYQGLDIGGDNLNPRTFCIPGAGALQLVDYRSPLSMHFEAGKELLVYHTTEELLSLIGEYLQKEDEARKIAKAGHERAINEHTFKHRAEYMLKLIS